MRTDREVRSSRLQVLDELGSAVDAEFSELAQLTAMLCEAPICRITLLDERRHWVKAAYGSHLASTMLEAAVCLAAAQQSEMLIVEDLMQDARFDSLCHAENGLRLRFCAGYPLRGPGGDTVGTLCIFDVKTRQLETSKQHALEVLARQVQTHLELRLQQRVLRHALAANRMLTDTLAHTNENLSRLLNAVPTIIIGLETTGRISHWNSAAERTFQLAANLVQGRKLFECGVRWLSDQRSIEALCTVECIDDRSDHAFELHGEKRWLGVKVCAADQLGVDSRTTVLLSGADITQRRVQEEHSRQVQKMEAIGQLAAGIAHEINTPTQFVGDNIDFVRRAARDLTGYLETVDALRDDYLKRCGATACLEAVDRERGNRDLDFLLSEVPAALDQAFDGTQRIGNIVKAMKEFSHPGSQEKTSLDLNHAVEMAMLIARSEWKHVAQIETALESQLPQVLGYPGEINQVLLNLLVNATHAIAERARVDPLAGPGVIRITTRQTEQSVELTIEDNGAGIPLHIQSRVFDLFFTTKDVGKGTGQGLAFAHSVIVKKHGGQLWLESEPGKGTTFWLRVPRVPPPPTLPTPAEQHSPEMECTCL